MRSLRGAIQYLTILPAGAKRVDSLGAAYFPIIGALIGASGGLLMESLRPEIPFGLVSLLLIVYWSILTGGIHESGFSKCLDDIRELRLRGRISVPTDVRAAVGYRGAVGLLLLVLVRWQALAMIGVPFVPALAAMHGVARAAMVAMAWSMPPAGHGSGFVISQRLRTSEAVVAIAAGVALAIWVGGLLASILLGAAALAVLIARRYFRSRAGGFTEESLHFVEQSLETFYLIVFTCRVCAE